MEKGEFFNSLKGFRFIESFYEGMRVSGVYLVKTKNFALTRNGKEYINVTIQDKTGQNDAKIWDPNSPGIAEFEPLDYVYIEGSVSSFNGANQLSIQRLRKAPEGSYEIENYLPVSKRPIPEMEKELEERIGEIKTEPLKVLLTKIFIEDKDFRKSFFRHSAAKTVHHGFVGGLSEHTLSVASLSLAIADHYPFINRDLLLSGALLHDIGKVRELTEFPLNDYSDSGQLIGHIVLGYQMVCDYARDIADFPPVLKEELLHLILSHHGELEYGSPKKPALIEAMALNMADNLDAKIETMYESIQTFEKSGKSESWIGYNRFMDSNIRKTE